MFVTITRDADRALHSGHAQHVLAGRQIADRDRADQRVEDRRHVARGTAAAGLDERGAPYELASVTMDGEWNHDLAGRLHEAHRRLIAIGQPPRLLHAAQDRRQLDQSG